MWSVSCAHRSGAPLRHIFHCHWAKRAHTAWTIWKTCIQHSNDGACCIRCVVIICYCWRKIYATCCVFFTCCAGCCVPMRFSWATLIFHFVLIDHPCEYDVHTVPQRVWEEERNSKGRHTMVSCGSITPAGICDANISDRDSWAMKNKWTSRKAATRKLSCFRWIVWWKKVKWNLYMTLATTATTENPNKNGMNVRWLVICDTFQSDTHTHATAHYILFSNKNNKYKSVSSPVRHIRERLGSERHDTKNKKIQTIEKKQRGRGHNECVWYGSLWVHRCNVFPNSVTCILLIFSSSVNWYVSFGSRVLVRTKQKTRQKKNNSGAAAAHEINKIKYQVYECIDLIFGIAKDIWYGSLSHRNQLHRNRHTL